MARSLGSLALPQNDYRDLHPDLKQSLTCLEKWARLDDPDLDTFIVMCGTSNHPPKIDKNGRVTGDPYYWGAAVDTGHDTNPSLTETILGSASNYVFRRNTRAERAWGSSAQQEYNSVDHK